MLINVDPFNGNKCEDKNCLSNRNLNNRISRKNNIEYKTTHRLARSSCWLKFESQQLRIVTVEKICISEEKNTIKKQLKEDHVKKESQFIKHIVNKRKEVDFNTEKFDNVYDVRIVKAYRKMVIRLVDEG